ncbi:MAG: methyltransferase [Tidjanibacter sp.]|nr:methyltransferase [Tidjanibacter sp.]
MSKGFSFKRFSIEQQRSAMKVGTDGVLLGAWADLLPSHRRILDVGCGTGLIALMAAQRTEEWGAEIVGVEIDPESAEDARQNVARSEWSGRVEVVCSPVQEYSSEQLFDHIISNPPYFVDSLLSPDKARTNARHTTTLSFDELTRAAARLLAPDGVLSLVLPCDLVGDMTLAAVRNGLFLSRRMDVKTKASGAPIRALLEYRREPQATAHTTLTIHTPDGDFTPDYRTLTRAFYLKF